ncbi:hypothetical protein GW17_00028334 [Ensete ventricosum]|nr:hypothetical protein GW17_00028334 [Ensete ventricosum]
MTREASRGEFIVEVEVGAARVLDAMGVGSLGEASPKPQPAQSQPTPRGRAVCMDGDNATCVTHACHSLACRHCASTHRKAHGQARNLSRVIDSEAQRGVSEVIAVPEPTHEPNHFESVTLAHSPAMPIVSSFYAATVGGLVAFSLLPLLASAPAASGTSSHVVLGGGEISPKRGEFGAVGEWTLEVLSRRIGSSCISSRCGDSTGFGGEENEAA